MNTEYIRASRYDLEGQARNRRVFHQRLLAKPWLALAMGIGMGLLGANATLNWMDQPRWNAHPWLGWMLGAVTLPFVCYFFLCALRGFRAARRPVSEPNP